MATDGLPARELHGLLELLGEVHHAETVAGFRTALLDVLPRIIPAAYTSYNEVGADGTPLVTMVTPEAPQHVLANWGRYGHQNPLVRHHLATRDPRAYRLSDVTRWPPSASSSSTTRCSCRSASSTSSRSRCRRRRGC